MADIVCLCVKTLHYPAGGGHFWAYLNWALGLKALGCTVIWAEEDPGFDDPVTLAGAVRDLRERLSGYGLDGEIAIVPTADGRSASRAEPGCLSLEEAADSDLLLNFVYCLPGDAVARFGRSALVDIDPGLVQQWMKHGLLRVAAHDHYFTIGETVGQPGSPIPDLGLRWTHSPPCVVLEWWPPAPMSAPDAAFTTVTHWWQEWMTDDTGIYANDKRAAFQPYLDLPRRTGVPLELAIQFGADDCGERSDLIRRGWRLRDPNEVAGTPQAYQRYIRSSRGEFSCAKPGYVRHASAWISDRTICYLASAKPAVVQHTGPSRFLPDAEGLLRFRTPDEAARLLDLVASRYNEHSAAARALAERHFDARKVIGRVLDRVFSRRRRAVAS